MAQLKHSFTFQKAILITICLHQNRARTTTKLLSLPLRDRIFCKDRHSRQSVPFSVRVSYQRKVQMFHEEKIRTCHKMYLTPTELTLSSFLTEAVVLLVLLLFFGKQNNIRHW